MVAAAHSTHPAVSGCKSLVNVEFEDAAQLYKVFGEKVIRPLKKDPKTRILGAFISSGISEGNLELGPSVCKNIEYAIRNQK